MSQHIKKRGVLAGKNLWRAPHPETGVELESRLTGVWGGEANLRLRGAGSERHFCWKKEGKCKAPHSPHQHQGDHARHHKGTLLLIWQRMHPAQGSFQQLAGASGQSLSKNQLGINHEAPSLKIKPKANRKSTQGGDAHVRSPDQHVSVFLIDFK